MIIHTAARKFRSFRKQVVEKGLLRTTRITIDRALVWTLAKRYSFQSTWHPSTSARPYRLLIADAVNSLQPTTVCEVGCGLGSILARVRAPIRIGYDIEPGVVRAAHLIRSREIDFRCGTLKDVSVDSIDVLILVNWIHEIAPATLARDLLPILPRVSYLVVDAIDPGQSGYLHHHDFAFLKGHAREQQRLRASGEGRSFLVYAVEA